MPKSAWVTTIQPNMAKIVEWARQGATNREISEKLGIHEATLYEYLNKQPEFDKALREARTDPNKQIEAALFRIAKGTTVRKVQTVTRTGPKGELLSQEVRETVEEIPPNAQAAVFWLCNMLKDVWRREPTPAEIESKESGVIMMPVVVDDGNLATATETV